MAKLVEKFSFGISEDTNREIIRSFDKIEDIQHILIELKNHIFNNSKNMFFSKYNDLRLIDDYKNNGNEQIKSFSLQWNNIHGVDFSNLITIIFMSICGKNIGDNFFENFISIEFKKTAPACRPKYLIKLWTKNIEYENLIDELHIIMRQYNTYIPECYEYINEYITNYRYIYNVVQNVIPYDKYISYISKRKFKTLLKSVENNDIAPEIETNIEKLKNGKFFIMML